MEDFYTHSTTAYELVLPVVGGADGLVYVLRDGVEAREERHRRLRAGELSPADWPLRPI